MGWIAKLFGVASKEELEGLSLDHSNWNWAVEETQDLPRFLSSLHYIASENAVIYLEGCNAKGDLKRFIDKNAILKNERIARGTVWPKQNVVQLPATKKNVDLFAKLTENISPMEIATHFHIYEKGQVILEWYDAFTNEMFVSNNIPEEKVKKFASSLGVSYENEGEQAGSVGPR